MEKETNSNAACKHHVQGDRKNWSNVRKSTHLLAAKASAGIKNDVCAELKTKRHQAYLCINNEKEQSKKEKEPTIPGEGVRMCDGQRFGQKLSVSGATMSQSVSMLGVGRRIDGKPKDSKSNAVIKEED